MSKTDIAREALSLQLNVGIDYLECIGSTDCSFVCDGAELIQFNVIDANHHKFKSTVAYKYGWNK